MKKLFCLLCSAVLVAACGNNEGLKLLDDSKFEALYGNDSLKLYTLRGGDLVMQVSNLGGRVISLWAPDRNGNLADVVVGYGNIDSYLNNPGERYLGANVGPVANRIADGRFVMDNALYELSRNEKGITTLHGGENGIDMQPWTVLYHDESSIVMLVLHPDGLDGFPGNTVIKVKYTLTEQNEFKIEYNAISDRKTPVNLAHHSFFNLTGRADKPVLNHELTIKSEFYTPVDKSLIPTGEIAPVEGTPFDFRTPHKIGGRINVDDKQLKYAGGYDHNWVICRETAGVELDATLYEPTSGRVLEVYSDKSGLQFYAGNFFNGSTQDKYGRRIGYRCAVALETQMFPDAVHHDNFPDITLEKDTPYTHTCIYKFSTR